jgi:enamine deaminase RidA (YjgF/YER057c/UK114 family)
MTMSVIEAKLAELGHTLPAVAVPLAAYVPAVRTGNLVFTSGQLPTVNGVLMATGKVGADVDLDTARAAAQQCALNGLAAIKQVIGDLDNVVQVVKVVGFVAVDPSFTNHAAVVNGASEFLGACFGDAAKHARSSVGMASLPLDAPVEIEFIVEVRD